MSDSINGNLSRLSHLTGSIRSSGSLTGSLKVGMFNGKSAYEIAVENGFEGTEEEWLESLKGDAATIEVGTVTSGSPTSVTNSGDEHHAIFDFVLPSAEPATDERAGIMKLYDASGENTDGGMTQRAVTHAISDSASSISAEDLIAILI